MYFIGCSGWFYWHWKIIFYPETMPPSKWFHHYTTYFNTVELNSPFYHWPKQSTVKTWYRQSPDDFVYTLKVNRTITHIKKFKGSSRLVNAFYKISDDLKDKMGCFLFQLPPSLKFSDKKLKEIVSQIDAERKNVIEFRHVSWFREEVYDELRRSGIIFCIVSSPNLPEDFVKTSNEIYIRFHGKNSWYSYNYSNKEIEEWVRKIRKARAKNVWLYFNNDANAYAVKNSLYLKKLLTC
ncbi:MAG: DUF72 domain-containing protein [Nitrososphaerales archaeon]